MVFGMKSYTKLKNITIDDQNIKWSKNARYLGVTIDRRLNMNTQTNLLVKKAREVRVSL